MEEESLFKNLKDEVQTTLATFLRLQEQERNHIFFITQCSDDDDDHRDDNISHGHGLNGDKDGPYRDITSRKRRRAPNSYLHVTKATLAPWNKGRFQIEQWLLHAGKHPLTD